MHTIKCHHGTKKDTKSRILKTNFSFSHDGWFGRGIYFFENNYNLAKEWATIRHPSCLTDVVECDIIVDDMNLSDLTSPHNEDYKLFKQIKDEEIHKIIEQSGQKKLTNNDELDKIVFRSMIKAMDILVFKIPSYTPTSKERQLNQFSRFPNGVEVIAVKSNVINNIC